VKCSALAQSSHIGTSRRYQVLFNDYYVFISAAYTNNNKHTFIYRHLQENQNSSGLQTKVGYKIA